MSYSEDLRRAMVVMAKWAVPVPGGYIVAGTVDARAEHLSKKHAELMALLEPYAAGEEGNGDVVGRVKRLLAEVESTRRALKAKDEYVQAADAAYRMEVRRGNGADRRAERALKRAGFEDRGGEEWAPPVCPAETKIATLRADEPVSWHELTDRARDMPADGKIVITAAQVRALESDVAAFTQSASCPRMMGLSAFLDASIPGCVHGVRGPRCPDCPDGKTQFPVGVSAVARGEAYKTTVGHKVTGPELVWTMRDEFAKAAMQGTLASGADATHGAIARTAYELADVMIKARGETGAPPSGDYRDACKAAVTEVYKACSGCVSLSDLTNAIDAVKP